MRRVRRKKRVVAVLRAVHRADRSFGYIVLSALRECGEHDKLNYYDGIELEALKRTFCKAPIPQRACYAEI